MREGVREREWQACALTEFAQVALGHNFRGKLNNDCAIEYTENYLIR